MEFLITLSFLVAYFVLIHIIAKYAENKGRSYWGFWALSALFLPFGLVAALLVTPQKVEDGTDMKCCPFCAEKIKSKAIVCRYCGREVSSADVMKQQALLKD